MKNSFLYICLFLFCQQVSAQMISVVNTRKSNYKILISNKSDTQEKKAADIVQKYVEASTGVKLPINELNINKLENSIIISKQNKLPNKLENINVDLGDQGLAIYTKDSNVFILGGSDQGVIYAAYTFIDKYLGCKMFNSSKQFIPKQDNFKISNNLKDIQLPKFEHRQYFFLGSFRPSQEYLDWNKLQSYGDKNVSKWGVYIMHNINDFISVNEYFQKTPSFFALVEGKRVKDQLDYSNPVLHDEIIKKIKIYLKKNPETTAIALNPNDIEKYCQCDKCKINTNKYKAESANLLMMLNAVAKEFPNIQFSTLAFKTNRKPPVGLKINSNINMVVCDIEANKIEPIKTSTYFQNVRFREDLKDWVKLNDDILVWHYVSWYPHSMAPFPIFDKIQADLKYFSEEKVKGVFLEGDGGLFADFNDLKAFYCAKMMWNPNENSDQIINEYLKYDFGEASSDIMSYYKLLEKKFNDNKTELNTGDESILKATNGYLSSKNIQMYRNILTTAKKKVKDKKYIDNIEKLELGLDYVDIESKRNIVFKSNKEKQDIDNKRNTFKSKLKKHNITAINYYLQTADDYFDSFYKK